MKKMKKKHYKNMDEKRKKIKKYIEGSDISEELKAKELEIVANESFSIPEVKMALAELIGEEFDKRIANAGITAIPDDAGAENAFNKFESEVKQAEEDLENDMRIVDDNLNAIREASEEIQKVALQTSLNASKA